MYEETKWRLYFVKFYHLLVLNLHSSSITSGSTKIIIYIYIYIYIYIEPYFYVSFMFVFKLVSHTEGNNRS